MRKSTGFVFFLLLASILVCSCPAEAEWNQLPDNFFKNKPPLAEKDLSIYASFLELVADDTFENSFIEDKLAKDYKVKPDRIIYDAVKITVIVILDVYKNDEGTARVLREAYGPEIFPTEDELALVQPRLRSFALKVNGLKKSDVEDLPYFSYLFNL